MRQLWPGPNTDAGGDHNGHGDATSESELLQRIGRFEIRRALGEGGYGIVLLAFDPQLGREVALKIPRAEALVTRELRTRFQYEARIAAGLDHPNIVPVYDAGEVGPVCYIASAFCPGVTLAEWLHKRDQPVPFDLAAELVAVLADAVQHAHSRGVLHRDLKPSNIILTPRDVSQTPASASGGRLEFIPRLTDFGLAKLAEVAPQAQTRTGAVLGTPEYMSPEQAAGHTKEIGVATDVYALGVILYELLVGRPPFRGATAVETLRLIDSREPTLPSRMRTGLPRDLDTICLKCLSKEPPRRYLSARELAEDLRRYLAGEPVEARPVGRVERLTRWCRRNPVESALVAAVAIALLAGTVVSTYFGIQAVGRKQAEIDAAVAKVNADNAQAATDMAQHHLYLAKMLVAKSAWDEVRIQDLTDALAAVKPEHTLGTDYRRFEWYYWQRACHMDLLTVPVAGPAYCVRFSPKGDRLAIAGEAGKLWIADATTGRTINEISAHDGPIWSLSFTSDGDAWPAPATTGRSACGTPRPAS